MHRMYKQGAVANPPAFNVAESSYGYPTNGSDTSGIPATIPGAEWYYMLTEEIVQVILKAGLSLDATKTDQLHAAIAKMVGDSVNAINGKLSATIADIQSRVAQQGIPSGALMAFDRDSPPDGYWLVCDGRAVSRDTYRNLFNAIGTRHGGGDGRTTFNLPNYIDRTFWGATSGIGQRIDPAIPNIYGEVANMSLWATQISASGAFYAVQNSGHTGIRKGGWDPDQRVYLDAKRVSGVYKDGVNTVQPPAVRALICIHI